MTAFPALPLGQPIPASPHGVSCSLPTMKAVRGYEEKDPAISRHLTSGYPRFVVHPFARQLAEELGKDSVFKNRKLWLTASARLAQELGDFVRRSEAGKKPGSGIHVFDDDGLHGVAHLDKPELALQAKLYLQHVGGFLSSREAEDHLVRLKLKRTLHPEKAFAGDPDAQVRRTLRPVLPGANPEDIFLTNSGMNAFFAAFRSISELQAKRERTIWIQLGWLYLDTIEILKKFTGDSANYIHLGNPLNLNALAQIFAEKGAQIAGVVTEIPTNPLIQTPDVAALAELCHQNGAKLILDPSVNSMFSVNVFAHADILISSLTKYTASDGDVLAGVIVVNPALDDAAELRRRVANFREPLYVRDLARLAEQIGETEAVLARIQESTPQVAAFLEKHKKVKAVYWALRPESRLNYLAIARTPQSVGGMISFTLRGPLEAFYDALRLAKGPSFGMKTTLICPFMYLAHYDLVNTAEGQASLRAHGLEPDLLRLCIGTEPVDQIIAALGEALG
jgi:cystathionine gamma-synthase